MGLVRLSLEYAHKLPSCAQEDKRPDFITKFHYIYYSMFLFGLTSSVTIVISLLTDPIASKHVSN